MDLLYISGEAHQAPRKSRPEVLGDKGDRKYIPDLGSFEFSTLPHVKHFKAVALARTPPPVLQADDNALSCTFQLFSKSV